MIPIEGLPPDLLREPKHCPFAPRCRFVVDRCWQENPPLSAIAPEHYSGSWQVENVRNGVAEVSEVGEVA